MRPHHRPRPRVAPLPRAHALQDGWKQFALDELSAASLDDLPCHSCASMLPLLLRRASMRFRSSCEQIPHDNDELSLYYAVKCLRCLRRGDLPAAHRNVYRAPRWKMQQLGQAELLDQLSCLVRTLRLRIWTARSHEIYDSSVGGGGLHDGRLRKRAKIQRWSAVMAAWRSSFT